MTQVTLDLMPGTELNDAARQMVEEANRTFSVVKARFNGVTLSAAPFANPIDVAKTYLANSERECREYKASPEGKVKEKEREDKKIAMLNAEPKEFPVEVILSVTTGRLLTKLGAGGADNGIDSLATHTTPNS